MSKSQYQVFIIEDDFRIAKINSEFINKVNGFTVAGIANTAKEALAFLEQAESLPNLILLDVYIPDVEGLQLMWDIRKRYQSIDIIMITAAKEVDTIEEALRGGIIDYIIKPIEFARLEQTLLNYKEKQQLLNSKQEMTQDELDRLRGFTTAPQAKEELPKGIDRLTLEKVITALGKANVGTTAVEVSKQIGTSRSTARRYLEYLVKTDQAKAELIYGDVGRPERQYVKA